MAEATTDAPRGRAAATSAHERLDRIERAVCALAEAVRGTGQAGRWAYEQHFAAEGSGQEARTVLR